MKLFFSRKHIKRYITELNLHKNELDFLETNKHFTSSLWKCIVVNRILFSYIILNEKNNIGLNTKHNDEQTFKRIKRC